MLEVLVHLEVEHVPPDFQLLRIAAPDELEFTEWPGRDLANLEATRKWGDGWLAAGGTALAKVPSVIAPGGWNWLINPLHAQSNRIGVNAKSRWPWDQRLFRS